MNASGLAALPSVTVAVADYANDQDASDLVSVLNAYALDPMGGGAPLDDEVRKQVVPGLLRTPGAFSIIARSEGQAVGLANCFTGYSTFAAAPLVNVHDLVVDANHRGRGIGKALLAAVDAEASNRRACKVTLEVLTGNEPAKALYAGAGFGDYQLDPAAGHAVLWQKKL